MPLTLRNSAGRRRKNPDEKLPERPGESTSAQVMAPTRMKLRVRRRDGAGAAGGGSQPVEEEERGRESGGRSGRRKNTSNTSTTAAASSSSSPPTSSASASARAVMAAEEASPDSKCPICLDRFNNLAYLDRCLHRFCFPCIQEWSHNKAECPLCKQPFASILHSVRAEDDFKEYTLRPAPANSSVAATVAMVAAMASAARSDHQMRLMLRRRRAADGGEMTTTTTRRRRRERGGRGGGSRRTGERTGVWEWYLDSPPLSLPPLPQHSAVSPVVAEDSEEGEDLEQQRVRGGADLAERGVIFEGLTGLGGAVAPVAPNDRASRRLMTRLAARQRLQREGGTVRRLRERETVAFRRALYRCGIRVRGVAGVNGNQGQQQRDITAESFRHNPAHLNRLRPWLRRELTVLYGAHGTLVDIVQRIIMARLARHGLEDTPTIEEELRPFLLARTDHFLHELVSFARSSLSLESYDLQAVYEPLVAALDLDGTSSLSDSSSVIAISEGEEEETQAGGRSEERLQGRVGGTNDDVIQTGSCLSLSAWDDETPGPSYSTIEPSCSLASLSFSPAPQEAVNEEGGEKREEEGEEECLIVGYKKPIAERTPELVQLSSDTEEEEDKEKEEEKMTENLPPLPSTAPPLSYIPTIPPSTSGTYREEQDDKQEEKDGEAAGLRSRARSWSGSSGRSPESVCTLSPSEQRRGSWRDRKRSGSEAAKEKRRRKRRRRGRERSGTLYNPNRSIYPAMMRHRSHSPSPFNSSVESGSPLPPSPPDWEYNCSPLTSSVSSPSRSSSSCSSPLCSSPQPLSPPPQTPPTLSLSSGDAHHGEKPGGKRKYKSRHLDSDDKDPTWRPSSSHRREKRRERRERGEKERRKRKGRDGGRRRERQRKDAHRESSSYYGESSSSRRCREDRSPSVEIIYEGTITSDATQPPARKRRRKRHRKTQHSSSPVIITLDSDSSHDDVNNKNINSSSSSPLSSQQTVDFSDLPPLPLVHSAGVGGALDAEIGELPVDILDRGSDGSETEPAGQCETAGPIAIDNSDNSDHEVDVENVDDSGSLLGCNDDKGLPSSVHGQIGKVDTKANTANIPREATSMDGSSQRSGDNSSAPVMTDPLKRNSEVSSSDSYLLATILNDLKGIAAPKSDLSLNFEPSCSPDTRKKHFQDPCEVSLVHSNQGGWLAETRHTTASLPGERQPNDVRDQNWGLDLPTCRTATPPPPPLQQLKDCTVREEGIDVPPLLKQASPVQSYNRNTPPQLKHKDARSPHLPPISPVDLHSPHASVDIDAVGVNSPVDLNSNPTLSHVDNQPIPPISTLKKHFTSALALRGELASTSSSPTIDLHPSSHLASIDPHSAAPSKVRALTTGIHSTSHKPFIDSHTSSGSENSSTSADCLPHLGFLNSFHSSKLHSSCDSTKKMPSSGLRSSPINLHPVNSLSPINFHSAKTGWSKEKPAHTDSTSGHCRNKTLIPNSCQVVPVDLHLSSSVSAGGTPAGSGVFSGVDANDTSPAVLVSSCDSRTQNPSSPIDSYSSSKRDNLSQRCRESSVPTLSGRLSPIDLHPRSPNSTVDLHSSSAASEGLTDSKVSSAVNHEDRSPFGHPTPVDLHCTSPVPPANLHSSRFITTTTDGHFNHTALPSSTFHTSHRKCSSLSELTTDSDSKHHNHFDPSSNPQFPINTYSKQNLPIDSQLPVDTHSKSSLKDFHSHTDNHVASSSQSAENQWNSNSSIDAHSDSQSPIDERSASSAWTTHSHSAT